MAQEKVTYQELLEMHIGQTRIFTLTDSKKNFALLYKAAKYIADGSKHPRARKDADAATGKVDRDELEKTIDSKRNKD